MAAKFGCQGAIRPPEVDAQRMGAQRGCQASGARIVILCHVVRLKAWFYCYVTKAGWGGKWHEKSISPCTNRCGGPMTNSWAFSYCKLPSKLWSAWILHKTIVLLAFLAEEQRLTSIICKAPCTWFLKSSLGLQSWRLTWQGLLASVLGHW